MSNKLRDLLLASNLGLSRDHRLAGWNVLTILYHDGATSGVVTTLGTLLQTYNANYLELDERPLTDVVLKRILDVLSDQAKLVEVAPRKVRVPMKNGAYHIQQSFVYKITSSGIEYLTMMQRVIDADNTVTANITRIQEYCDLVVKLTDPSLAADSTQLYNDFQNMLAAYADVMKGMHKLDEDLSELANDLAFNHGGEAANHLQEMLRDRAIPAFRKLLAQGPRLQALANAADFSQRVARSQQGNDDLDAAHAVGDQGKMLLRFQKARDYTQRQLDRLAASFDPSPTAIDSSMDTVYLLFQTILDAIRLLSQEYDHIQGQTVDIQALTGKIDALLTHYQSVVIRQPLPRHLPQDREVDDAADLLDATTMGAVVYEAVPQHSVAVTEADNPQLADDDSDVVDDRSGLAEFQRIVMRSADHGVVDHDLEMTSIHARDEVIRLYSATGVDHYDSFAPFGRPIIKVEALPDSQPLRVHCGDEAYAVTLPSGFEVWFAPTTDEARATG